MNKKFRLISKFNDQMEVDLNIKNPINDILEANNIQKNIIGIQVGGVLGNFVFRKNFDLPLENFLDKNSKNFLLVIEDTFCPVDYIRFLTRFIIRELKIDSVEIRKLNIWIENIAQGKSSILDLKEYKDILETLTLPHLKISLLEILNILIDNFNDIFIEHIEDKKCKNGICRTLISAQCINACPAEVNIPGYISLMKNNEIEKAYLLMRKTNPLSLICGKVCARPCEDKCRRKEIEKTVGVRALQRYISEVTLDKNNIIENKAENKNIKIAIIGAGPAGLSTAYFLQRTGYQVDIYEALSNPGGILGNCIPDYRITLTDIQKEVKTITDLGVNIHYNCKIGKDIMLDSLKEKYQSIVVATGAWIGKKLPSIEDDNIVPAIDFLKEVKIEKKYKKLKKVVIVGGGDVAMDSARTSIRLGAEEVTLVSLEAFDDMPASKEEKEFALKENIKFISGFGLEKIIKNNDIFNLELIKCLRTTDSKGNFNPIFSKDENKEILANHIILAIGQKPDLSFLEIEDKSNENIYFVGDVIKQGVAIEAIAQAKKVSFLIDKKLGGTGLFLGDNIDIPAEQISIKLWNYENVEENILNKEELNNNFEEIIETYSNSSACIEAKRCMRCDLNSNKPLYLRE